MRIKKGKNNRIICPNCGNPKVFQKLSCYEFRIYYCEKCSNGFTYPVPKNIAKYYNNSYWLPKGILGILKKKVYHLFQLRRKYWIMDFLKKGRILDVGAGEAIFSNLLSKDFEVISIDLPSAKIQNPDVIKTNFLTWKSKIKFDAIVFWESLEHTPSPQEYIKKAASILSKGGYIFVEYPRADSLESRIFNRYWYHLDPPRHLSHLTPKGLENIFTKSKLKAVSNLGVPAFEYTITGFIASILNLLPSRPVDFFKDSNNSIFIIILFPLIIISAFIETCFFIIGQSPIYLTVARK